MAQTPGDSTRGLPGVLYEPFTAIHVKITAGKSLPEAKYLARSDPHCLFRKAKYPEPGIYRPFHFRRPV